MALYEDGRTGDAKGNVAVCKGLQFGRGLEPLLTLGLVDDLHHHGNNQSFDTVVMTLSLCTMPDDRAAVAESSRVLRSGGCLLLLEHVRSPLPLVRVVQRILDPLFVRFEGDHLLRELMAYLEEHSLKVERLERSKWGIVERVCARKG